MYIKIYHMWISTDIIQNTIISLPQHGPIILQNSPIMYIRIAFTIIAVYVYHIVIAIGIIFKKSYILSYLDLICYFIYVHYKNILTSTTFSFK